MKTYHALLILLFWHSVPQAEILMMDVQDIQYILELEDSRQREQDFLQGYFTSTDPQAYVDQFIRQQDTTVLRERLLYVLAEELAYQIEQPGHRAALQQLKAYQPQVMISHSEGPLPLPFFDIQSKVAGTENHWRTQSLERRFRGMLATADRLQLNKLQQHLQQTDASQRLALKQAISKLTPDQAKSWSDYFRQLPQAAGSHSLLVLNLIRQRSDFALAEAVLPHLPAADAQQLLRTSAAQFHQPQQLQLLFQAADRQDTTAFAVSLMKPLAQQHPKVEQFLLQQLQSPAHGASAAFALSNSSVHMLQQRYQHTASATEKSNIRLALSMHRDASAQDVLQQINTGEHNED